MLRKSIRVSHSINAGAMADIAFLLLIFFLVTTTIKEEKGLPLLLPPSVAPHETPIPANKPKQNILKVILNAHNQLTVAGKRVKDVDQIKAQVKQFVLNYGKDPNLSVSPKEALIALKIDKGARYAMYIAVLDQVQGAYYEMYGERVGLTAPAFRKLNKRKPQEKKLYEAARQDFPMNIALSLIHI